MPRAARRELLPVSVTRQKMHTHIFIGGLHRSGTSLVHRLLCGHPSVSGFSGTGVPEDEGQHLQTLYPPAKVFGGPGRFALKKAAHLTENNRPLVEACKAELWTSWAPYWDLSKLVLLEKSPPNLIRSRFLQAVFPGAKFIFVIRHPLAVAAATQKWAKLPIGDLARHWVRAHEIFLDDLAHVKSWAWFRYEDLTANTESTLAQLYGFAGLEPVKPNETVVDSNDAYFEKLVEPINAKKIGGLEVIERFGYRLSAPYYEMPPGLGHVALNLSAP